MVHVVIARHHGRWRPAPQKNGAARFLGEVK